MSDVFTKIVVIKRNGADGPQFPLRTNECLFGRKPECDIRIQLPNVSLEHAVVRVDKEKKIKITNLSSYNQTLVNGKPVHEVEVQHLDVLTISDRSFRFEIPLSDQKQVKSPKNQHISASANTPQGKNTPKMPTTKGSPRTPPTGSTLKENICILRRHSMPLQEEEEEESSALQANNKMPFSSIDVNVKPRKRSTDMQLDSEGMSGDEIKAKRRSKRVSFGPVLSPEQFDRDLPPSTPLRRGAMPKRTSICGDHSFIASESSAKRRRSVAALPQTEFIEEEVFDGEVPVENETPKRQGSELGKLKQEELVSKRFAKFSSEGQEEFHKNEQLAQKSLTPKESEPGEIMESAKQMNTPTGNRRSSLRLAGKSPSLSELQSALEAQPQTVSPDYSVEEVDETVLDSDDYTSDEEDEEGRSGSEDKRFTSTEMQDTNRRMVTPLRKEIAGGIHLRQTEKKIDTPLRKEIANGIQLRQTKKKMATPLRKEIAGGVQLRLTKKKIATPLRKEIADGVQLRQTKKKIATPLRKEIADGIQLRQTKKKIATPLRKEIADGIQLRQTKKKIATPLRKEIANGIQLRQTKKKIATPLRKEIADGVQLRQTKKKIATPLRKEIADGIQLRQTKKKIATPLRKEIADGIQLRQTKKKITTPLRKEIADGIHLRKTKKKIATPLREEIAKGFRLRQTKKKIATPLRKEIADGIQLRQTKKKIATPLRKEIADGIQLRQTKKKLATPVRKEIADGIQLRQTKKKMATPLRKEIADGIHLRKTKKKIATPLQEEIVKGIQLRQTKKKMATPLREEIIKGIQLRETHKKLKTPIRKAIENGVSLKVIKQKLSSPLQKAIQARPKLRSTKKMLATPVRTEIESRPKLRQTKKAMNPCLQDEIKRGVKLRKSKQTMPLDIQIEIIKGKKLKVTKKSLPTPQKKAIKNGIPLKQAKKRLQTPVRRQIEEGITLEQTNNSLKRRSENEIPTSKPKKIKLSPSDSDGTDTQVRRALKTPLRKAIAMKTKLRPTHHRLATPVRRQIQSKPTLRTVRRKSSATSVLKQSVLRKPTYAEIVKRPARKTNVKRESTKKRKSSLSAISGLAVTKPGTLHTEKKPTESGQSSSVAQNITPCGKSTRWMSSLARAANGVKTRATPMEDLQGVAEMFQTPPTAQINGESSSKVQKTGNWLSSLAKAANGPRRRGTPVEDLVGVSEMFATPPCVNKLEKTSDDSTFTESPGERELNMIAALKPSTTPSLRRSEKDNAAVKVATLVHTPPPQAILEIVQPLALSKTPSLRHSAQEVMSLQVVSPVQVSRTPSLRSAKKQSSVLTNESPDLHLEFSVPPIEPSKTPSMRSSDDVKVVLRKSIGNPRNNRQSLGLQGLKRLLKSPKQNNAADNCEELFVPGLFASPKPQPKRYSSKSEGLQGVPRLLGSPDNKDKTVATTSPKLDGIKAMMQAKDITSPNFVGLRVLMKTPKSSGTVDPEEHFSPELFASTEGDSSSERDHSSQMISIPVIDLTSPESQESAVNKNVDSTARITRGKRNVPKDLTAPHPKRARRTRSTDDHQDEGKLETCSKPKLTQKKTTSRNKSNPAIIAQTTPKPFVFKRTQLDPIIEVPSPSFSFNAPSPLITAEEDKTWQGQRRTRSTTQVNTETKPPLQRYTGRGKCAQSETLFSSGSVGVDARKTRSVKKGNQTVRGKDAGAEEEVEQPKMVKTRSTRSSQVQKAPSLNCTSLVDQEVPSVGETIRVDVRKNRSVKKGDQTVGSKDVGAGEEVEQPKMVKTRSTRSSQVQKAPSLDCTSLVDQEVPSVGETIRVDVRKNRSVKKGDQTVGSKDVGAAAEVEQPKMVKTRSTRSSQVQEAPSLDCTSLFDQEVPSAGKTRATRSHNTEGSHAEKHVDKSTITNAPRRSRRGTKTVEEDVTVSKDTKSTRNTRGKELELSPLSRVPPRKTRTNHALEEDAKVQPDSCILEETKSTRNTRRRNTVVKSEDCNTRIARSSRGAKIAPEEDKKVHQERSAATVPPKRQMKGKASSEPKKARSTGNAKPEEEEGKITLLTTRGTKRRLEEDTAISPVPEPKRTTRSSTRIQTRSGSRK